MQPLQNCIGPTIRIGWEILCLPYAGFLCRVSPTTQFRIQNNPNNIIGSEVTALFSGGCQKDGFAKRWSEYGRVSYNRATLPCSPFYWFLYMNKK